MPTGFELLIRNGEPYIKVGRYEFLNGRNQHHEPVFFRMQGIVSNVITEKNVQELVYDPVDTLLAEIQIREL